MAPRWPTDRSGWPLESPSTRSPWFLGLDVALAADGGRLSIVTVSEVRIFASVKSNLATAPKSLAYRSGWGGYSREAFEYVRLTSSSARC
jgi:hypothetical protein